MQILYHRLADTGKQPALRFAAFVAGVHHVFDTAYTRTFSLLESQREFVERFQRKEQDNQSLPMMTSACPGIQRKLISGVYSVVLDLCPLSSSRW